MRFERKYKLENHSLETVTQSILLHPAGFRKIFPDRQVNNIYLDTPHLETFHDNVDGVAFRKKYRIRWYGNDFDQIKKPIFEIKIKENMTGKKEFVACDDFSFSNVNQTIKKLYTTRPDLPQLSPSLMNSYVRSYYGSPDGNFRITIDRQLSYFPMLYTRNFSRYNIFDPGIVLELKYDFDLDGKTDFITQYLPYRATKSSKYVTGLYLTANTGY